MKKLIIILSSVLLIFAFIYTLAFTSIGNNLLKPTIESKINESSPVPMQLSEFVLRIDRFKVLLKYDDQNTILAQGTYSLFSQDFDIDYKVSFNQLANLNKLASKKLTGKLLTDGKVTGNLDLFKVKGKSNLANSDTSYAIVMKDMNIDKAAIKLSNLNIKTLLNMAGEKPYTSGKIDLLVQIQDLDPKNMQGSIALDLKNADLNADVLKKEFGITLSKTALNSNLKAKLEGENINYDFKLYSELAKLLSNGNIQLQNNSIKTSYQIDITELALLKSITNSSIRGPLSTSGHINGDKKNLLIKGTSDIAQSQSSYDVELKDLNPSKVILHIKNARLNKALYMAGLKEFANANLNADIQFNDLSANNMEGSALINLTDGEINQQVMEKEFDIRLPKTIFTLSANTKLKPENINYKLLLSSNLAKISSSGDINPKNIKTSASYNIDIKELALLKPITNSAIRGPLETSGTVTGDKKELLLKGLSTLASSNTSYSISLQDLKPKTAKITIENAELSKLLYLTGEPRYAQGNINLKLDMSSIAPLTGKIKLDVTKGIANAQEIKKAFDISLPYTSFDMNSDANIKDDILVAQTDINSNLATLNMKNSDFNIKTSALKTDYKIYIPSLEKLEPLLERKLVGKVTANGDITKDKKLTITAYSNIFDGKINAKIVDENVNADFTNLHAVKALEMLDYPQIMDAPLNGTFVYNTKTRIGKLDSSFDTAVLTRSKMTDLVGQFTNANLTKERFNKGTFVSNIDKDIIRSELKMNSENVTLNSKKFIINSKEQLIDSRFFIKVKKYSGDIIVTKSISSPNVGVDFGSLLDNPDTKEKVNKEINRFLKKLF